MAILAKRGARKRISPEHKLSVLQGATLSELPWLAHGFSVRPGGMSTCYEGRSLNLGFTKEDNRDNVEENRKRFLFALGGETRGEPWPLIVNRQVHSDIIHIVNDRSPEPLAGDGLITNAPGIVIAVLTADCLPVLVADAKNRIVGAFHAGWRGTVKRIVEKGVGVMRCEFGSRPEDIYAAVGPGIQKCCYAVGDDLKTAFASQFAYATDLFHDVQSPDQLREKYPLLFLNARAPGHGDPGIRLHLDLTEANRRQLIDSGVPEKQISVSGECTSCDVGKFFSHRADEGCTGRMMAAIGIKLGRSG